MRLYRILLYLYPSSFRSEYGGEMCKVFAQQLRMASNPISAGWLWIATFLEILFNAALVHWDILRQDLGYTLRGLARSSGFALTAIVVTALGIGANTAVFSVTDRVLIRPLPYEDSERLVRLWESSPQNARQNISPPNYRDWQRTAVSFESMGAYVGDAATLIGRGDPRRLAGTAVATGVFESLTAKPFLGRSFTINDERADASPVVILSDALWRAEFGGSPQALGATLRFGDEIVTVIGVMPSTFQFPDRDAQYWRPMSHSLLTDSSRGNNIFNVLAKLKASTSIDQARAEMLVIADQIEHANPKENESTGVTVEDLRNSLDPRSRLLLGALFGASICVLLIACTNLASLMLARAAARRTELSVRSALGAGRERLVRQLLTECLVLASLGGVIGLMVAAGSLPFLARLVPAGLPIGDPTAIDLRVLTFAGLVTGLTGVGFGIIPALRICSADLGALRAKSGARRERLRPVLVVAQVTGSIVLLVSSGLLIRALWSIQAIDPGFRPDSVFAVSAPLPSSKYSDRTRRMDFYSRILPEVRALPGVTNASFISYLPMVTGGGIQSVNGIEAQRASLRFVTPDFFASLRIPFQMGRDVLESDTLETPLVAVVSQSFAQRYLRGADAIGQEFDFADERRRIVGVVGDIRVRGLERDSEPQVYIPYRQMPREGRMGYSPRELVVRSSVSLDNLVPSIRRIILKVDPQLPLEVRALEDIVADQTGPRVAQISILGAFAALSLLLAGLGVHGLLSFAVSQRIPEIGLRLALGASTKDILSMVTGEAALLASVGCTLGLILGYVSGHSMESLLAGITPGDVPTFASALVLAFAMAVTGSLFPALRAIRVNPNTVIRTE